MSVSTLSVILLARQEQQWAPISSPSFRMVSIVSIIHSAGPITSLTRLSFRANGTQSWRYHPRNSFNQLCCACFLLNGGLLQVAGRYFESDITSLMHYLAYNKQTSSVQKFWVAGSKGPLCQAIFLQRGLRYIPCTHLPPSVRRARLIGQTCRLTRTQRFKFKSNPCSQARLQSFMLNRSLQADTLIIFSTRDHLSFRFIGIPHTNPFARFSYSTPYTPSSPVIINGLAFGSRCVQGNAGSEDRLFLNIFTPFLLESTKSKNLKPALSWIHGGGFTGDQGSDKIYDGGNMAGRSDVVVVTINYRCVFPFNLDTKLLMILYFSLGTLGFLALNDDVTNGNFGIADQITALQ